MTGTDLTNRIARAFEQLGPAERVVAEHLREHPDDVALYSSAEIARITGVSKATVSRLLRRLGWGGAQEARDEIRSLRSTGVPLGTTTGDAETAEARNLTRAYTSLDAYGRERLAATLTGARRIVVIGFRTAFPVALHLRGQLTQARAGVELAPQPGQSIGEELAGLDTSDVVILFGFRRRPRSFDGLLLHLLTAEIPVVLITEPGGAPGVATDLASVIECPIEAPGPFDSYGAAMALVARIASDVHRALGSRAIARVLAMADLYEDLDELDVAPGAHRVQRRRDAT
jgi:DNA-binding MurR/RpiR family transcriptional regulator